MSVNVYTFKLPADKKGLVNDVDTVVVVASSVAIARQVMASHYPGLPKTIWDGVSSPSAEVAAADWAGWRITVTVKLASTPTVGVNGSTHKISYTGIAGDTTNLMAAGLNAAFVADPTFPGSLASTDTVTLAAADSVGDSVITARTEYVGNNAALDPIIDPASENNLQNVTAFGPTVQAVQAAGATRTIQVHAVTDMPRVVGFFRNRSAI